MILGEHSRQGVNGMRLFSIEIVRSIAVSAAIWFSLAATTAQTPTSRIVTAANHFLSTLTGEQRQTVLFAYGDEQQRTRWSNFPTGFVPRGKGSPVSTPRRPSEKTGLTRGCYETR
jgi:hypothetical protein